jgi:uncharacterized protein YbbK (DUF523 family)
MYLVSACLAGAKCRYDGESSPCEKVIELVNQGKAIPICPEQLGGLTTPRASCEIQIDATGDIKMIDLNGINQTKAFIEGAKKTLAIAKTLGIQKAILKSRSPSCGYGQIYNGEFQGKLIEGKGICATYLEQAGLHIETEEKWGGVKKC